MNYPANAPDAHGQLRAFFERIERLHEERQAIGDDIKEVFAEAKGNGFDTKAMKIVLQKRRMDQSARLEQEAIVELYMNALGMTFGDSDAPSRVHAHARDTEAHHDADAHGVAGAQEDQSQPAAGNAQPVESDDAAPGTDVEGGLANTGGDHVNVYPAPEGERPEVAALPADNVHVLPERAPLRPHCLTLGPQCAGQGRQHCYTCQKALADSEGMSA